jgi:outer membrane lipoprotein-sorting protein
MARIARTQTFALAVVAALALALVVGLSIGRAESPPNLPPVAADQLIASSLRALADRTSVSGTLTTRIDLGLPQLPDTLGGEAGPASALLSDQTFKEWRSPDGVRVAQILPLAERVIVADRTDVWAWDSEKWTAWHVAVPEGAMPGAAQGSTPPEAPSLGDLEGMVQEALQGATPHAAVSVDRTAWVAGRPAYVVAMVPTSTDTLVGRIEVAIDAETRLPLRLQVFPRGSLDPAIEAGFTSVDFGPIDPAMFTFTPPPGGTVKQVEVPANPGQGPSETPTPGDMPEVRTFGEGFSLILAVRVTDVPKDLQPLFPYAGPLGSADLVNRGDHAWIVAGAVAPDALAGVEPKLP